MRFILLLFLLMGCSSNNEPKVVGIIDGDTIKIVQNKQEYKVRLAEIDCPERGQPFGTQAKNLTSNLVFGKTVEIKSGGWDRYHRVIGEVFLPDGRSLNKELVRSGLAWQYKHYSKDNEYEKLEREARQAKRGLWIDKHPVSPWEWRNNAKRKTHSKAA